MNRPLRLAVAAALLAMQSVAAQAQVWAPLSRISDTIGNETGRVCVGGGADFVGCPSQSLYVTSGGQVGIGTATPSATLDVHGTVSTTYLQLSSPTTVLTCNAGFAGAMRYTSGTMQVCDGSAWGNIGISVPTGTIAAFNASSCPSGWMEYTASRGRFLRGIDNGAGRDPDGTRAAGNAQDDEFKSHTHNVPDVARQNAENLAGGGGNTRAVGTSRVTDATGGDETRPKNVAVTFCMYAGFESSVPAGITTIGGLSDVSVGGATTGQVLAFDGSSWISSDTAAGSAEGDRITSGTHAVTVNTSSGYTSLSTGGTTWGYLSGGNSFLPTVVANRVSTTNISATHLQLSSPSTVLACNSGLAGAMRYTSGTMQVCDGSNWGNIGIGVPTGTIAAFAASSCPSGWTEYTASRGRFLRGIDNGVGNDPDGTRTPGNAQADELGSHLHSVDPPSTATSSAGAHTHNVGIGTLATAGTTPRGQSGNTSSHATNSAGAHTHTVNISAFNSANTGGAETRPKNVAVTFCTYSGFGSAITGAEGIIWDAATKTLTVGTGTADAVVYVHGQVTGGFGAVETGGTLNWNDASNARSGSGYTLLLGSAANGPGGDVFYHPFSFEYSSKNGTGNVTQLAIAYDSGGFSNGVMFARSRYQGTWSGWQRFTTAAVSDYRAKENVRDMSSGIEKVMALNPVVFDYKDGAGAKGRQDGFLAHELAKIAPYAVSGKKDQVDDAGNAQYQSIDLARLTPLLTAAVQELKKMVDALASGLRDLKAQVDGVVKALADMKAEIDVRLSEQAERQKRLEEENAALKRQLNQVLHEMAEIRDAANDNHAVAIEELRREVRALRAGR